MVKNELEGNLITERFESARNEATIPFKARTQQGEIIDMEIKVYTLEQRRWSYKNDGLDFPTFSFLLESGKGFKYNYKPLLKLMDDIYIQVSRNRYFKPFIPRYYTRGLGWQRLFHAVHIQPSKYLNLDIIDGKIDKQEYNIDPNKQKKMFLQLVKVVKSLTKNIVQQR